MNQKDLVERICQAAQITPDSFWNHVKVVSRANNIDLKHSVRSARAANHSNHCVRCGHILKKKLIKKYSNCDCTICDCGQLA